jgi:hypothetical protein
VLPMQAEWVSAKLQLEALRKLQQGRDSGELVALSAALAREWGHGSQLATIRARLAELERVHHFGPDDEQEGIQLLKKRNMDRWVWGCSCWCHGCCGFPCLYNHCRAVPDCLHPLHA